MPKIRFKMMKSQNPLDYNKNLMQQKFPEEKGIQCLSDVQMTIVNYLTVRPGPDV